MDCLSPSNPIREVNFMKCAQIGGTETGKNWMGFTIDRAPTSMLVVEPTVDVASKLSKQKVAPMLEEVPCLKGKVRDARSRDSGNTILMKEFLGGMLVFTGANSGVGLRFMSAQNLMLDEVDAYPYDVDGEGSPVEVAKKRTLTYARYKIYRLSTPLLKRTSIIEPAYENSDQRIYMVPCPHCDHGQELKWSGLTWKKGEPENAVYLCNQCEKPIPEHHKTVMLEHGRWEAQKVIRELVAGFKINALYAPYGWVNSWARLAMDWSKMVHDNDQLAIQTFINTNLGETWDEDGGEKIEHSDLWERREIYPAPVPDDVMYLTAAVDVQDDRLEAEAKGWGRGEQSWNIEKQIFWGSPGIMTSADRSMPSVWELLDIWLMKPFAKIDETLMKISIVVIDSGGHHTKEVYQFVRPRQSRNVFAVKGSNQPGGNIIASHSRNNLGRVLLRTIGTNAAKDTIYSRLRLHSPGPGYIHWPQLPCYDEEHFKQLTAEAKVEKKHKGVVIGSYYKKTRARNEALDLEVMNMAALAIMNPQLYELPASQVTPSIKNNPAGDQPGWVRRRKGWIKR